MLRFPSRLDKVRIPCLRPRAPRRAPSIQDNAEATSQQSQDCKEFFHLCQWQLLIVHKTILWNTVAVECQGDGDLLNKLRIKNVLSGEDRDLPVNGLFYAIGKLVWLSGDQYALRRMDRTRTRDGAG